MAARPILLNPDEWAGRPFPLIDSVIINNNLKEGRWQALLYRPDCRVCAKIVPAFVRSVAIGGTVQADFEPVLIELPPSTKQSTFLTSGQPFLRGRLSNPRIQLRRIPVEILIDNGIVRSVRYPSGEDYPETN